MDGHVRTELGIPVHLHRYTPLARACCPLTNHPRILVRRTIVTCHGQIAHPFANPLEVGLWRDEVYDGVGVI